MKHFENISSEELRILQETVCKVAALIAYADGKVDIDETYWAEKIASIRSYGEPNELNEFYTGVDSEFSDAFQNEVDNLPNDTAEARQCLSDDIARANDILPKLSPKVSYLMYKSYTSFAKHIAKASGGFMGFFSIGSEEAKLIDLPMLHPIDPPKEEEDVAV